MFKLTIEDDEGKTTVVPLSREEMTIGRLDGNTIRLTERNISRKHARLVRQNGAIYIEDLASFTGVRVNGTRIAALTPLREGDEVQIGDYKLALKGEEPGRLRSAIGRRCRRCRRCRADGHVGGRSRSRPAPRRESAERRRWPGRDDHGPAAGDALHARPRGPPAVENGRDAGPVGQPPQSRRRTSAGARSACTRRPARRPAEAQMPAGRRSTFRGLRGAADDPHARAGRGVADGPPAMPARLFVLTTDLAGQRVRARSRLAGHRPDRRERHRPRPPVDLAPPRQDRARRRPLHDRRPAERERRARQRRGLRAHRASPRRHHRARAREASVRRRRRETTSSIRTPPPRRRGRSP